MKFIYSKWNEKSLTDQQRLERLLNLFSYILLQTSGDVNEALDWMSQLDEQYNFFDESLSLSDFIDILKQKVFMKSESAFVCHECRLWNP